MSAARSSDPDVVVIGGGHNGLTAAAYLAGSGRSVVVLERRPSTGGLAVSQQVFAGVDARLSRYSYLVSLLPRRIVDDLRLPIRLARRTVSSYTPVDDTGLLDAGDDPRTARSFAAVTGDPREHERWVAWYRRWAAVARRLWPTMTEPMPSHEQARTLVADDTLFDDLTRRPLYDWLTDALHHDLTRGIAATDALIGTFAALDDPTLVQNRCLLYHLIGGGTGDWAVPVGGMGAVTDALADAAIRAGATIVTDAEVIGLDPATGTVTWRRGGVEHEVTAGRVLAGCAPAVIAGLVGDPSATEPPEGSQLKINMVLRRLPRLRDDQVDPTEAFAGTVHLNESASQLELAFGEAAAGRIPSVLPCEVYCHTLTDPSIMSAELARSGAHTLTLFGLHTPARLFRDDPDGARDRACQAALRSLDSLLAEPIEDCLLLDEDGRPCLEVTTPVDLDHDHRLPGGHIFHGDLAWPFDDHQTPGCAVSVAEAWGVASPWERVLWCGAGARRGGGVSGLGGHNAAMAVLHGG